MVKKGRKPKPKCVAIGADVSYSVIALSAKMYDAVLDRTYGPVWYAHRFKPEDGYFDRLKIAALAHDHIHDCMGQMKGAIFDFPETFIGIEEPVPFGMMKHGNSASIKQQCEINGAFIGGLLRYGFENVIQVNSQSWKSLIAADMDMKQNKEFDKWTVVEWVKEVYSDVPDWPDLIRTKNGLVSQPETSVAKPVQPDDRYDACGIMEYTWDLARKELKLKRKQNGTR